MKLEGSYNDMASTSANMGFPRVSGGGIVGGTDSNDNENVALGGLIDVRPKKLHNIQQSLENRKSQKATKDNLSTVMGSEGVVIQSKPRGGDVKTVKSKMPSSRSRSKVGQMLSTQGKKDGASDAELRSDGGRPVAREEDGNFVKGKN